MDQAHNLRQLVRRAPRRPNQLARVFAVSSGKGGVGKTSTSVNLAIALAAQNKRAVVLDADLGLANVEVLMGLNSFHNLQHVIDGEKTIMEIVVKGPGGIEIVPGTSGLAKLADLGPPARQNILDGLKELQEQVDYIIIDTMAGIGQNAVSFCAAADEVLVVTTPEPSSIVDAYALIKSVYQIRNDAVFRLVINMVANHQQALAVMTNLSRVAQRYLTAELSLLGHILRDPHVSQGVMQTQPFALKFPNAPATKCIHALAGRILEQESQANEAPARAGFFRRFAQSLGVSA